MSTRSISVTQIVCGFFPSIRRYVSVQRVHCADGSEEKRVFLSIKVVPLINSKFLFKPRNVIKYNLGVPLRLL